MPIPVSVTGFATSAGAHSAVAGSTNIDLVAAGTAPRAAATNDGSLASMMNMDTTPVATAAAAAAPTPAAKPASDRAAVSGEVLVEVNGLDFCYPATGTLSAPASLTLQWWRPNVATVVRCSQRGVPTRPAGGCGSLGHTQLPHSQQYSTLYLTHTSRSCVSSRRRARRGAVAVCRTVRRLRSQPSKTHMPSLVFGTIPGTRGGSV
jgi:hypothetical protein